MSPYSTLPLITAILSLCLGVFILFKGKPFSTTFGFILLCITTMWWQGTWTVLFSVKSDQLVPYLVKFGYSGIIFIPFTFYHFVVHWIGLKREKKWLGFCYLIGIVFLGLLWTSKLFIKGYYKYPWGYYPKAGLLHPLYLIILTTVATRVLWVLGVLLRAKDLSPIRKNQFKYTFTSFAIYALGSSDFIVNYGIGYYPFGFIFVIISLCLEAFAIVRYRIIDIKVAVTRAGIFAVVYALVLGIPFGVVVWARSFIEDLGYYGTVIPLLVGMSFASAGPFIFMYLRRRAEDVILAEQRRYQNTLRQLSGVITLIKDLERLLKLIVLRVARAVKVGFACIYLASESQSKFIQKHPYTIKGFFPDFPKEISYNSGLIFYIRAKGRPVFAEELTESVKKGFKLKSGLIIPSFVRGRLLGFLVLGPKASGAIYTQEDANVFGILANQLALAIENSQFLEESQKTQARLFAAEQMASLGTMAGGMTHQINNRFHAILLASTDTIDTLKLFELEQASKDQIKEVFEQIKHGLSRVNENAKHGGKIANDFLNFSQPDRLQKEAKEFDLREPLERAIEMVKIKTAFPEGIIIREFPDYPLTIQGNFVLIQDAYFNLIDNALDALERKKKAIENKELPQPPEGYQEKIIIRMSKPGSSIITQIQDNGVGMTEETQKKIFVPFFTTKATSVKGTGLGLFVIKKIIEAHGGTIKVESEYGQGATFTITLPITQKERDIND